MASATPLPTFSFHLSQPSLPKPKPTNFPISSLFPKTSQISIQNPPKPSKSHFIVHSIDVSQEDKPAPDPPKSPPAPREDPPKFDARRLEEKFAVLNTGIYECRSCGHRFDEAVGDPSYPVPPGLPFEQLPEDWRCPTCGAAKSFFQSKSVEIAGFEQNQQFGLGGNALTSGQKAVLIYGSLLFFFVLFLSGYFLQ